MASKKVVNDPYVIFDTTTKTIRPCSSDSEDSPVQPIKKTRKARKSRNANRRRKPRWSELNRRFADLYDSDTESDTSCSGNDNDKKQNRKSKYVDVNSIFGRLDDPMEVRLRNVQQKHYDIPEPAPSTVGCGKVWPQLKERYSIAEGRPYLRPRHHGETQRPRGSHFGPTKNLRSPYQDLLDLLMLADDEQETWNSFRGVQPQASSQSKASSSSRITPQDSQQSSTSKRTESDSEDEIIMEVLKKLKFDELEPVPLADILLSPEFGRRKVEEVKSQDCNEITENDLKLSKNEILALQYVELHFKNKHIKVGTDDDMMKEFGEWIDEKSETAADSTQEKLYCGLQIEPDTPIRFYAFCTKEYLPPTKLFRVKIENGVKIEEGECVQIEENTDVPMDTNRKTNTIIRPCEKEDLPFKCTHCEYASAQSTNLKRHVLSKHGEKEDLPFKCTHCEFACAESGHLKVHVLSKHGEKEDLPFKCTHCEFACAQSGHLKRHVLSKHGKKEDLPFKCTHCEYACAQSGDLKVHVLSKHGKKEDLPFKCTHCEYACAQSGHLKVHVLSKHGEKEDLPFKCTHCEFACAQSGHLKFHVLSKHGEKEDLPFKCTHCEYASAQSTNLKSHVLSKHGEKEDFPFKCTHCEYATARSGHLKRHKMSKHC